MQDWTGNTQSVMATLNASNHSGGERADNDYYATPAKAVYGLLGVEQFSKNIWEVACGEGHISDILKKNGYNVLSTDLIWRGYGDGEVDFLRTNRSYDGDIVTNPPFKYATEFVRKALETVQIGNRVAMFLRIQFLEGVKRRKLFDEQPPKLIYVSSRTLRCAKNGDFENATGNASTYAWFIWQRGFNGTTALKWFN